MLAELSAEIYEELNEIVCEIFTENILECELEQSDFLCINYENINCVLTDEVKYSGHYVVTPKVNEVQTLKSKDKFLSNNITVAEIPYFEVSNNLGKTVYIGKEIEIYGNQ